MGAIKFKKKTSAGDTEHIFVTPISDKSGNVGYVVEVFILTKHPEMYKYDYVLRLFKGCAVTFQATFWAESTLREIIGAIDEIKKHEND